jgi:hypothetical protein
MVTISTAVKYRLLNTVLQGPLGQKFTYQTCRFLFARFMQLILQRRIQCRSKNQRAPAKIVDQLGINMLQAAVNIQTGNLRVPADFLPYP